MNPRDTYMPTHGRNALSNMNPGDSYMPTHGRNTVSNMNPYMSTPGGNATSTPNPREPYMPTHGRNATSNMNPRDSYMVAHSGIATSNMNPRDSYMVAHSGTATSNMHPRDTRGPSQGGSARPVPGSFGLSSLAPVNFVRSEHSDHAIENHFRQVTNHLNQEVGTLRRELHRYQHKSQTFETEYNKVNNQLSAYKENSTILQETVDDKEAKIQKLNAELADKNKDIEKLRITVSVQGKQIQKFPAPSPHRQRGPEGLSQSIYQYPPPKFPLHASRSETNMQFVSAPVSAKHVQAISRSSVDEHVEDYDSSSRITQIFKLTSEWALNFTNKPDSHRERGMPADLLVVLNKFTLPNQVQKQLASEQDRYLLIASFINHLIVENIYRVEAFQGFDAKQSGYIADACKHMELTSRSHIQRAFLQVMADAVCTLRRDPCFPIWIQERCDEFAEWAGEFLATLIAPSVRKDAVQGLKHIFGEAFQLSVDLFSVNRRYKFDFVRAHRETFYNQHTMLNRDLTVHRDPNSIRREEYRVRLCISPTVVVVDFVGEAVVPKTVHLAEVLLWKP